MVQVFLKLFNMSVSAGWVILAVMALRPLLKKAPKNFRLALWAVAAFRLICPLTIESVLSLIPSAETVPAEAFWVQTPEVQTGVTALNSVINPILETTMATEEFNSAPPMFLLFYFFSYLWLIGLTALGIYGIVSYLILRRKVAASVPVRENIRICDSIATPFILGYVRPKIYLPSHLPPEQWEPVIAHEQAHLKRRDYWIKLLGFALLCVYWFQPLVWVSYILLCRDIELACDERVIRNMDSAQKKRYSEALLACGIRQHSLSVSPLAFGEVGVKARIKAVLDYKKPALWIIIAAVAASSVLAVCFLTDPGTNLPDIVDSGGELFGMPDYAAPVGGPKATSTFFEGLKNQVPQYMNVNTFKGLEVYIWEEEGRLWCGLLPGTNARKTQEQIADLYTKGGRYFPAGRIWRNVGNI